MWFWGVQRFYLLTYLFISLPLKQGILYLLSCVLLLIEKLVSMSIYELQYFEDSEGEYLELSFDSETISKQEIPTSFLYLNREIVN